MLFPQSNQFRSAIRLPDFWEFRFDPDDVGREQGWASGFDDARLIAVPASWNDVFEDGRDFLGPAWYQVRFRSGGATDGRRESVRFDSVSYFADVWLNGTHLGRHEGAHLPFEFATNEALVRGENLVVVRVDGRLSEATVPGAVTRSAKGFGDAAGSMFDVISSMMRSKPSADFDFFPYAGIQRLAYLESKPADGIAYVAVDAAMDGTVTVAIDIVGAPESVQAAVIGTHAAATAPVENGRVELTLRVEDPELWGIGEPNLYELVVEARQGDVTIDSYRMDIGFRTIAVDGHRILLNGESIEIRGFGRHEDFPVYGRGYAPAVAIKDFSLLRWTGANSFRTSHYPYCEEQLQLADRMGVLVISEAPAVSFKSKEDEHLAARLEQWRRSLNELVARDRNHPSVVMWSVGNEPMDFVPEAAAHITEMIDRVKAQDATRPVFIDSPLSHTDESHHSSDVIGLHAYPGWYADQGNLAEGLAKTRRSVESLATQNKPIIITEIGADTIAGHHAQPPEMFSEEYQTELIEMTLDLVADMEALAGVQWWNLCDFKTGQGVIRPKALNHKGLFTRERRPKMAAHRLRERWLSEPRSPS